MADISSEAEKIVIAVVSNPNFFLPNQMPENRIKTVCDLIKAIEATINK